MDTTKVPILLLPFFLTLRIDLAAASAPADEFILDRIYTADGSPGKFVDMSGFKIKRANRSTFLVGGDVVLLEPMDDDMTVKVSIIAVDEGGDKYLFTRERENICSFIFKDCLPCRSTIEAAHFDPEPNSCPMEKGLYKMPMQVVARLRKDWPLSLKTVIPPLVPFENWKLNMQFFREGELLDELIIAFRLVNELSAV